MKDADLIPFQSGLIIVLSWGSLTEQNTSTIFFNPISLNSFNKIQILSTGYSGTASTSTPVRLYPCLFDCKG